jgi:HNH endonuclease
MSNDYRLVGLGNSELLVGLSALVQQSNVLTGQLLAHLVELDERKLHLELGFSSLFAYCVESLGMSQGSAGRRVTAAGVCRRFPEVFERVARGELHLCALCALAPHLNPENANGLFEASRGKTRRQVEELLAARFPRPDAREQIRRLPVRPQVPAAPIEPISPAHRALDNSPSPSPSAVMPPVAQNPVPRPAPAPVSISDARRRARELEPLSADRFGVHFTADAELRDLIERARALASHRLPNGDLAGLMKLMAASFVRREEKRRFGIGARPRRAKAKTETTRSAEPEAPPGGVQVSPAATEHTTSEARAAPAGKRGRYVPAPVRREIHERDRGRCAFVSADGRRCDARAFLQVDHVKPYARSGAPDAQNLRLLCRAHNLLHARNCFGAMHIAAKIAMKKRLRPCGDN